MNQANEVKLMNEDLCYTVLCTEDVGRKEKDRNFIYWKTNTIEQVNTLFNNGGPSIKFYAIIIEKSDEKICDFERYFVRGVQEKHDDFMDIIQKCY
jgi:hypothetical protein